jgi:histidinol-phosphate aminotransferase
MTLPFKPHIAKLPAYKPPTVPPDAPRIVDLSSNENPLGPSPKAMDALRAAVGTVHRYPDASATDLKAALAERTDLHTANIAIGNGADEWVLLLCLALLEPGDEVIMAWGSFISYWLRGVEMGANVARVPLLNYTHDLDAIFDAVTPDTRIIFCCNPNNPTGTMVDPRAMEAFLARVPERVLVVLDEAYFEYANGPAYFQSLDHLREGRKNLVVLRSFSKIYGLAGLRVGYMLAHETVIDYMERARPPFNVNRLAQVAALAALDDEVHVQRSLEANDAAKEFFYRKLRAMDVPYILSHTNFIAIDVGQEAAHVSGPLLECGFVTTALDTWGVANHLRFSFGTQEENEAFARALQVILAR